jgi:hypothetical protein
MFNIYKKLIITESIPLTSPNTSPNTSPIINPISPPQIQTMDTFSLCNCCCNSRSNKNPVKDIIQDSNECSIEKLQNTVDYKYEFGHATHYVYNSNTPRIILAFDTGTPP